MKFFFATGKKRLDKWAIRGKIKGTNIWKGGGKEVVKPKKRRRELEGGVMLENHYLKRRGERRVK